MRFQLTTLLGGYNMQKFCFHVSALLRGTVRSIIDRFCMADSLLRLNVRVLLGIEM